MTKGLNAFSIIVIVGLIGGYTCMRFLVQEVPIGYVGVRTQHYAFVGSKGVKQEDFGPGWHRNWGPVDNWTLYDSTVQTLEFSSAPQGPQRREDLTLLPEVPITSDDGNPVKIDVTVKYRIKPGAAHLLLGVAGAGQGFRSICQQQAFRAFRDAYGQMVTEDFYDPEERDKATQLAFDILSRNLDEKFHLELVDILLRDVRFEEGYEQRIRQKKLADQQVELNKSLEAKTKMEQITETVEAETEAMALVIASEKEATLVTMKAETDKEIAQISADAARFKTEESASADRMAAELVAQGILLEREAEAYGENLKAQALQGSGGANYVALQAARNLRLSDITVSTVDTPFLEVSSMAEKLGASVE